MWQTWALVLVYFATFGGFLALTAWLPKSFASLYAQPLAAAGGLAALYSVSASLLRVGGGPLSDRLGGERVALLALLVMALGSLLVAFGQTLPAAIAGVVVMAVGMGVGNAAVFKLVPQEVPKAVGGASGWVGGLGAFGGFVIPNLLAAFVRGGSATDSGYRLGFLVFTGLAVISMAIVLILGLSRRGTRRA